ncbi:MAG: hypothetical protein ACI9WU_004788 [Myxococcota bacterium]
MGVTDYTDGIVRYVTAIVDNIAWYELWRPVFDPPPMNTYTYRPLTAAIVKLELLLSGRDPVIMTALHSLSVVWYGFAVYRFLQTHDLVRAAGPAALSAMMLPSLLFAGWIPVESDTIGAAFLCEAGWALQRWRVTSRAKYLILFGLFAFGAGTTKETSAAAMFGYLVAFAWVYRSEDDGKGLIRYGKVALAYGVALFIAVLPLVLAKGQQPHQFHVAHEGFNVSAVGYMLLHDVAQVFYLIGAAGIVLIALRLRPGRLAAGLGLVLLAAAPPLRIYNHYESVIIDQWWYVVLCGAVLLVALLMTATRRETPPGVRIGILSLGFLIGVLVVAPIVALQTRPDVSARLFAPVVPILHGLAWDGGFRLLAALPRAAEGASAGSRTWHGVSWVLASWVLVGCFGAFALFGATNGIWQWRARMGVELEAKSSLAELLKKDDVVCPFVIAVNRNHELAVEELEAMGVEWTQCSTLFVPNRVKLDPGPYDLHKWRIQGHTYSGKEFDADDMRERILAGQAPKECVYLFLQTPRAMMDSSDFEKFAGDFAWAFDKLPEFDDEAYVQQIEIRFRETTSYEKLFRAAGAGEISVASEFFQLPSNPNEALQRVLRGVPVIERYAYQGIVMSFEACLSP